MTVNIEAQKPSWAKKLLDDRLIDAAQHGKTEEVQRLLAAGANVHATGDYALALAAAFGHTETVFARGWRQRA
jgi:hypothetical protein